MVNCFDELRSTYQFISKTIKRDNAKKAFQQKDFRYTIGKP